MKKKKIALIFGGPSNEHEVAVSSANMVFKNLDLNKYTVDRILIHKDGDWQFLPDNKKLSLGQGIAQLKINKYDLAFLVFHGIFGEDGHLQAILETIKLPFTGSGMIASAIAMDKVIANIFFANNKFNVPKYQLIENADRVTWKIFPAIVKPVNAGSSIATYLVKNKTELTLAVKKCFKTTEHVMIQQYISGREFTCGVVEKNKKAFPLLPTEIISSKQLFDYEAKYQPGVSQEITPPDLSKKQIYEIQQLGLKAHEVLGCRGMSRSDFILKDNKFFILETNTIPGMTPTSLLPQGAKAMGIDFPHLLDLIIKAAL
jgi:D-alanine-D-alanine ligase